VNCHKKKQDWRINVLVFDVQSYGQEKNFLVNPEPPSARYALLRSLEDDFSKVSTVTDFPCLMIFV
jgi:hypothetical protein